MTPNLTPTPRVDKTGKTVIRHMRNEPVSSKAKTAIPAPDVRAAIERSKLLLEGPSSPADREELATIISGDDSENMSKIWHRLAKVLPEEAVTVALDTLKTYPHSWQVSRAVRSSLRKWRTGNQDRVTIDIAFAAVEHHFEYRTKSRLADAGESNIGVHALSHVLDEEKWDDKPTTEQLSKAVSVAHAVAALTVYDEQKANSAESYDNAPAWAIIRENTELMDVVASEHERALDMAEFIKERGGDVELLREFLRFGNNPLSEGIL